MATFKISRSEAKGKTWKAIGKANPRSEASFDARHDATGMTPKKYINKLRWDNKAPLNSTIEVPDELFEKKERRKNNPAE